MSHNLEQNVIDGEKTINNCLPEAQSKDSETHEFKLHEVMFRITLCSGRGSHVW